MSIDLIPPISGMEYDVHILKNLSSNLLGILGEHLANHFLLAGPSEHPRHRGSYRSYGILERKLENFSIGPNGLERIGTWLYISWLSIPIKYRDSWAKFCENIDCTNEDARLRKVLAMNPNVPGLSIESSADYTVCSRISVELLMEIHFPACLDIEGIAHKIAKPY